MPSISHVAYPLVEQIMPAISRHVHYGAKIVRAIAHVAMTLSEASVTSGLTFVRHEPGSPDRHTLMRSGSYQPKTGTEEIDALMLRRSPFTRSFSEKGDGERAMNAIIDNSEPVELPGSYTMITKPTGLIGITSPGNAYFEIDHERVIVHDQETNEPIIEALHTKPNEPIHGDDYLGHGKIQFHGEVVEHAFADEFGRSDRSYSWSILADSEREAAKILKEATKDMLGPDMPNLKSRSYRIELDL